MPAPLRNGQKKPRLRTVPDGVRLYSTTQAAAFLGCPGDTVQKLAKRGVLTPARFGSGGRELVFTRADLERHAVAASELAVVASLEAGATPIEAYQAAEGRVRLAAMGKVIATWARLSGFWIMEGPPGSLGRWLQRLGLIRLHTTDVRRMIEILCRDPDMAERARLALDEARSARELAERARSTSRGASPASDAPHARAG